MRKVISGFLFSTFVAIQLLISISPASANKVTFISPSTGTLGSGQSQIFEFGLQAPIICPTPGPTCKVVVTFTNPSPATVSLNASFVEWAQDSWSERRFLTVTAADPLTPSNSSSVRITSITTSDSVFYQSYVPAAINLQILRPLSAAEIAEQDRIAAAEAARLRAIEIESYRTALFAKLARGERPTVVEYNKAAFNQITNRTNETVSDQILALEAIRRSDVETINSIADGAAFYDAFFNPLFPASVATYAAYGYTGVTARTLAAVNAQVQVLPLVKRKDGVGIQEIATIESFVDQLSNPATQKSVTSARLIQMGLLAADSPYKFSVTNGLKNRDSASLNSLGKIKDAIASELSVLIARKDRTAAIKAKIAARNK